MQAVAQQQSRIFEWDQFAAFARLLVAQTRRRKGALSVLVVALETPPEVEDPEHWRQRAMDALAEVLSLTVRNGDMVGRHGRESFAVVAVDTRQVDAIRLAKRIRAKCRERALLGASLVDWVAVGIATQPESGIALRDVLNHAEMAATEARAGAGGRVRMFGWDGSIQSLMSEQRHDLLTARRQAARQRLIAAYDRGQIRGVKVQSQPGACPVCQDAAREVHRYDSLPTLPLVGCTMSTGCRCNYASPALLGQVAPAPVPLAEIRNLEIPGKLHNAALFGSDPRRRCKPADLAEYLEHYPFLWIEADLDLEEGEHVLLRRRADYAWERITAASSTVHGLRVPIEVPLVSWLSTAGKAPALPRNALLAGEPGTLYLTNRRLLFHSESGIEAVSLLQIADVEYLRDGVACRADDWQNRLVFLVDESLLVGMSIARAIRSALFDH